MRRLPIVILLAALVAAGCGSSSSKTGGAVTTVPQSVAAPPPTAASIGTKPTVTVPSTPPPATLQVTDLVPGTGAAAKVGDTITVQYVGLSYTNKKQFDSSWDRGSPATFPLAQGQLIDGWVQGIPGMKIGGRRQLIIPPALGYGASPPTPAIAPNDTLIFVIDLVKIG
jgi:peptidylprolyl isomerase